MKKATVVLTSVFALGVTPLAFAQQHSAAHPSRSAPPATPQSTPSPHTATPSAGSPTTATPSTPTPSTGQPTTSATSPSTGQTTPAAGQTTPAAGTAQPGTPSTTTITSAEPVAPATAPPLRGEQRDTITLKQPYRPNRPLLITGGLTFLATYATTAAVTAGNDIRDANGDHTMYIPVAGPWVHLATTNENTFDSILIAGSGALQGLGVGLGLLSLVIPEKVPLATIQAGNTKLVVTPTAYGRGSAGVGVTGQF